MQISGLIRAPTCTYSAYMITGPRGCAFIYIINGILTSGFTIQSRIQSSGQSIPTSPLPHLHLKTPQARHLQPYPYPPSSSLSVSHCLSNSMAHTSDLASPTELPRNTIRPRRPRLQDNALRAHAYTFSQSRRSSLHGSPTALRLSWLFRSNIPARRGSPLPDIQKRNFFGMSEIIGVLANVRTLPLPHYMR